VHPYLIDIPNLRIPLLGSVHFQLPTYGVLVALAIVVGWVWLQRGAARAGIDPEGAASATFWAIVGGMLGGKLGLVLVDLPSFVHDPRQLVSLDFIRAAGLIWTGVIGGIAGFVLTARRRHLPLLRLLDVAAVPVPLCQAIGRVGCLMAGCCFGSQCDLPWAVVYHSAEANARTGVPLGIPLHPAPLYEALWSLGVVLPVLLFLRRRTARRDGELIAIYLVLYGTGRFFVEFARGDDVRGIWFGGALSTSQLISLALVPLAALAWIWLRRRVVVPADPAAEIPAP
jgi:phosphatidylglycerol---prolipoprotein diacylglyceryl transferase